MFVSNLVVSKTHARVTAKEIQVTNDERSQRKQSQRNSDLETTQQLEKIIAALKLDNRNHDLVEQQLFLQNRNQGLVEQQFVVQDHLKVTYTHC